MTTKIAQQSQNITFNPKHVAKRLLGVISERARDVIKSRYGLGDNPGKITLEAIGKKYGITRERVRQIENYSLGFIRKSKEFKKEEKYFEELKTLLHELGGVIAESDLLNHISKDKSTQNHTHFMLVLGDAFNKHKEDEEFHNHWHVDHTLAKRIKESLRKLYQNMSDQDLVTESDIVAKFLEDVKDLSEKYQKEEVIRRWLSISKQIGKNKLGEWGKSASPNINAKGIRDYAFLVIRKHGSPIHFKEVAKAITEVFNKKAHVATTHNELIKDPRFVLVGRGLYALAEWGYMSGVVKDVIKKILEKNGPLTKDKIIEKVLKERYVKENTIMVNLQNGKYFKKDKEGKYHSV